MSRQYLRAATVAVTLAFAAGLPAAATAAPLLTATTTTWSHPSTSSPAPCSEVCSNHGYGYGTGPQAAAASPAPCSEVCSNHGYGYGTGPQAATASGATLPHDPRPRAVVLTVPGHVAGLPPVQMVNQDSGFHWGDAGIGAGSMLAMALIGLGGAFALTHRRDARRQRQHRVA